jgi:hypothetical protein
MLVGRVLLYLCVVFFSNLCLAQVDIARLFTTPQDRVAIEEQKRLALSANRKDAVDSTMLGNKISLDAVLVGKKTAIWVNRQLINDVTKLNGVVIDPKNASLRGLWLSTPTGRKLIKQGQVYLTESGKVVERYEAL